MANATAFHGNCHGNPPTASAMAIRGNCHGTPRLLPRQFPRTSNHSNFHGIPQHSAAIRGNCHGNPPVSGNCHRTPPQFARMSIHCNFHGKPRHAAAIPVNCHGNFHGRQPTAVSTENHGIPRPSAAIATAILQYAAIVAELHGNLTDVKPLQFTRHSAAIVLPHSAAIGSNCHGRFYLN